MSTFPAYSYDRVSTDEQAKGHSLNDQLDRAEDYANRNNLNIIKKYSAAESAWKEGRKEFNRMIDDAIDNGVVDLIFKNTDRMARNGVDWIRLKKLAKDGKIRIHLYELNTVFHKDSTAEEEMFLDNTASYAAYWSNKISQGVKAAYRYKAKRGIPPAPYPVGYLYDKKEKLHYIDPDTRDMIQFIHDEYDFNTISIKELADRVNKKGYRAKNGKPWQPSSIYYLLSNSFYAGVWTYQGEAHRGNHEQYIDYDRYQDRLERMGLKFTGEKKRSYDFPFANLLFVGNYKLTGEIKREKHIYYTNRITGSSYKQEHIIQLIDAEMEKISLTDEVYEYLKESFREVYRDYTDSSSFQQKKASQEIAKKERDISKLLDLFIENSIDKKYLKEKIQIIKNEIKELESEKDLLTANRFDVIDKIVDILDTMMELPKLYNKASPKKKAEIVKTIASRVRIEDDRAVLILIEPMALLADRDLFSRACLPGQLRTEDFFDIYLKFVKYYKKQRPSG